MLKNKTIFDHFAWKYFPLVKKNWLIFQELSAHLWTARSDPTFQKANAVLSVQMMVQKKLRKKQFDRLLAHGQLQGVHQLLGHLPENQQLLDLHPMWVRPDYHI